MYHLYAYKDGVWKPFVALPCPYGQDYREQMQTVSATKERVGKTDAEKNGARVARSFVCDRVFYETAFAKTVMRALRYFDEVGISNELHEALKSLLANGFEKFALVQLGEEIETYTAGDTTVRV